MSNHLHVMIGLTKATQSINPIIGNDKRFMAYEIRKRVEKNHEEEVLNELSWTIELSRKQNNKLHNVGELSFDRKHCESEQFINQKLDFYHINPVKGVWHVCESPIGNKDSSAKFYLQDTQREIERTSYAVVLEAGLQNAQRPG